MAEVEKDGRRISDLLEGSAFGEMAVLGLTSGQSVTIKAWSLLTLRRSPDGGKLETTVVV